MKLKKIPVKIANILSHHIFKLFGFDRISQVKINKRNDLKKIGTSYGGWTIPTNLLDADSICYCVGCGEDISFDIGLINQFGCDVFAFDPTPRAVKHVEKVAGQNPKYHFYEIGLWDKEDTLKFYFPKNPDHVSHSLLNLQKTREFISVKVKRLKQIMEERGHNHIDLLKLDIEGAEYKVIHSIIEDNLEIKVLCVEYDEYFHPLDKNFKERIRQSVENLMASGYVLVHTQVDGNYTFV